MRARAASWAAVTVAAISLMAAPSGAARAAAWVEVLGAYSANGETIPPCEFSSARLDAALGGLPPDLAQYGSGLVDGIQAALAARATGRCADTRGVATGPVVPSLSTVAGPPTPPGSVTAVGDIAVPAVLLMMAGVVALLALGGALALLVRSRGWQPEWAAKLAHTWGETGYRAGGLWAEFADWVRLARPAPIAKPPPLVAPAGAGDGAGSETVGAAEAVIAAEGVGARHSPVTRSRLAVPARVASRLQARSTGARRVHRPRVRLTPRIMAAAAVAAVAAAALVIVLTSASTSVNARDQQVSIFQDDDHLLYNTTPTVERVLGFLKALGVDRIRVTIKWSVIAPAAQSRARPAFDATDPAAYPAAGWVIYDRIVRLARADRIGVDFDVTAPGPLWAMRAPPRAREIDHYAPSARELGLFVAALGRRYSGTYVPTAQDTAAASTIAGLSNTGAIPRVSDWSIWNEPNQPGWLAPQWRASAAGMVPESPRLYREYVNEAVAALELTGHSSAKDSILIGDLAPVGSHTPGAYTPMTPMQFLRALYCVDQSYRPLAGGQATALGCPARPDPRAFATGNPGLFNASGFGHHPYDLLDPPDYRPGDPDVVTLSTLSRLTGALDRIFRADGVQRRIPVYVTEYGYQTNPPDPYQIVTPAEQAAYLDQAAYIAWRNTRVRSFAQFLLYDAKPDSRFSRKSFRYWDTFQTGLLFADGRPKPALVAYGLPIWLPSSRLDSSGRVLVWGQLRSASTTTTREALIQWRASGAPGSYRTIATVTVADREGYFTALVDPPARGRLLIAWRTPDGRAVHSRSIAVTGA